jgi:hypothetical protein
MEKLINWSELSRHITGGDRKCIRSTKIPRKHYAAMSQLIYQDLPKWWEAKINEKN